MLAWCGDNRGPKSWENLSWVLDSLVQVSDRLRDCVRQEDLIARLGGDEFAIILTHIEDAELAAHLADRILKALSTPFSIFGKEVNIGGSIGIGLFPDHGKTLEQLVKNADTAMYMAKEGGRNNYQFYRQSLKADVDRLLALEKGVKEAIANGEIETFLKPAYHIESGDIAVYDTDMKWQSDVFGEVCRDDILKVAEKAGLTNDLFKVSLKQAAALHSEEARHALPFIAPVPVTYKQIEKKNLHDAITLAAEEAGLSKSNIIVKVSDQLIKRERTQCIGQLEQLNRAGVKVALYDMSISQCTAEELRHVDVSYVLFEKLFIGAMYEDEITRAVINAMLYMLNQLNIGALSGHVADSAVNIGG